MTPSSTPTTPKTSSPVAELTVVEAVEEAPEAEAKVPRGVDWLTPEKVITPTVAPSLTAPLKVTTTLFVPVAGATSCQISMRIWLAGEFCDPTRLRLVPL